MAATKLTKKQQKAVAFRSGGRAGKNKSTDPADVEPQALPEFSDDEEEAEGSGLKGSEAKKGKREGSGKGKAAASVAQVEDQEEGAAEGAEAFVEGAAAKRRRRKKASLARAAANGTATDGSGPKASRLIVFVGNLPFDVEADQVQSFFASHCGETPQVRLLTTKKGEKAPKGPRKTSKTDEGGDSKGCAFVEFATAAALQKALRVHHSPFPAPSPDAPSKVKSRKINVELSAGGGGSSTSRLQKLDASNARLAKQREKRVVKEVRAVAEKKARGEAVEDDTAAKRGGQKRKREGEGEEGKKEKVKKVTSGANAMPLG